MTGPLRSTGDVQADPEALLKAANILRTQAADLDRSSQMYIHTMKVGECGTDPISKWAAQGFNEKIQPMSDSITQLVALLKEAAQQLVDTAQTYQASDQQVKAAFSKLDHGQTFQEQVQAKMNHGPVGQTRIWRSQ